MKYKDSRYPDKINDLVNNDGTLNLKEIDGEFVIVKPEPTPEPQIEWKMLSLSWENINHISGSYFYAFDFENDTVICETYESGDPYDKLVCTDENNGGILFLDSNTRIAYLFMDPEGSDYTWLDGQYLPFEVVTRNGGDWEMKMCYADMFGVRGLQFIITADDFIVRYTNDPNYQPVGPEPEPQPASEYSVSFEWYSHWQGSDDLQVIVHGVPHKFIKEIGLWAKQEAEDDTTWKVNLSFAKNQWDQNSYDIYVTKGWDDPIEYPCALGFTQVNDTENTVIGQLEYNDDYSQTDLEFLFNKNTKWHVEYVITWDYMGEVTFGSGK